MPARRRRRTLKLPNHHAVITMPLNADTILSLAIEQLAAGERVWLAFDGRSMLPTLSSSDKVLLAPLVGEPQAGDVLLFRMGDRFVVHRLLRHEGEEYVLRGDNNMGTERVPASALLGKVVSVKRKSGRLISTESRQWRCLSRRAAAHQWIKATVSKWLGRNGRKRLRPWYFCALAFLMWAPLNGVGIPLDNYILGLRADHLLHASVYLPCVLMLWDLIGEKSRRKILVLLATIAVGLVTEGVQWLLPWRGFDMNDLVANAIGATLGWVVTTLIFRHLKLAKNGDKSM